MKFSLIRLAVLAAGAFFGLASASIAGNIVSPKQANQVFGTTSVTNDHQDAQARQTASTDNKKSTAGNVETAQSLDAKKIVFTAGVVFKPDNALQLMAVMDTKSGNDILNTGASTPQTILMSPRMFPQGKQGNILARAASPGVSVDNSRLGVSEMVDTAGSLGVSDKAVNKVAKTSLQQPDGTYVARATDNTRGYATTAGLATADFNVNYT